MHCRRRHTAVTSLTSELSRLDGQLHGGQTRSFRLQSMSPTIYATMKGSEKSPLSKRKVERGTILRCFTSKRVGENWGFSCVRGQHKAQNKLTLLLDRISVTILYRRVAKDCRNRNQLRHAIGLPSYRSLCQGFLP